MGIRNWFSQRKEKKETRQRFEQLSEEELQELHRTEKKAYLEIARRQVIYRGKINAYKDFPINDLDKVDLENSEPKSVPEIDKSIKENEVDSNGYPATRREL